MSSYAVVVGRRELICLRDRCDVLAGKTMQGVYKHEDNGPLHDSIGEVAKWYSATLA
jgi:hypothetical protein